jgi:hypothetical protein
MLIICSAALPSSTPTSAGGTCVSLDDGLYVRQRGRVQPKHWELEYGQWERTCPNCGVGPSAHACFHRLPLTPRGVHVHVHVHRATVLFARHLHLGRLTSHCSDCGHGTAQVREWQRPTHRCPTRGHSALLQHALAFVTADACDSAGSCAAVQQCSTDSCSAHRLARSD